MALPQSMKSLYQPSPLSSTLVLKSVPLPQPQKPTDHLIKVHAFAPTNDELTWAAARPEFFTDKEPVPGTDLAGVIVTAPESSPFKAGDRVFSLMDFYRPGAGREYAIASTEVLARLPESVSFTDGAAVPMGGLTAWQNLFVHGGLRKEGLYGDESARKDNEKKRVMVVGAGGGVGTWAVQLAALAGAEVIGVASGSKAGLVRSLGATEVVDYTQTTVKQWVAGHPEREVDLVLDCVGGPSREYSYYAVKEGGSLVTIVMEPELKQPDDLKRKIGAKWTLVERDGKQLEELGGLVADGKIKVIIDKIYGFDQWQEAFDKVMGGKSAGRVVVKVVDE